MPVSLPASTSFSVASFVDICSAQQNDGLQLGNSLFTDSLLGQLFVYVLQTDLIELVYRNGDIDNLVGLTNNLGNDRSISYGY